MSSRGLLAWQVRWLGISTVSWAVSGENVIRLVSALQRVLSSSESLPGNNSCSRVSEKTIVCRQIWVIDCDGDVGRNIVMAKKELYVQEIWHFCSLCTHLYKILCILLAGSSTFHFFIKVNVEYSTTSKINNNIITKQEVTRHPLSRLWIRFRCQFLLSPTVRVSDVSSGAGCLNAKWREAVTVHYDRLRVVRCRKRQEYNAALHEAAARVHGCKQVIRMCQLRRNCRYVQLGRNCLKLNWKGLWTVFKNYFGYFGSADGRHMCECILKYRQSVFPIKIRTRFH